MIKQTPLPHHNITCPNKKVLSLNTPKIMGILNVTPDSFSDGGQYNQIDAALYQVEQMLSSGAHIIDIGGESTRPQAKAVSTNEEQERVLPVVAAISKRFDTILSIDTSSPSLIQQSVEAGAHIWNDVRGLSREHAAKTAAALDIPVMLMHMRGEPNTMMSMTHYDDVILDIQTELMQRVTHAHAAGVKKANMILDVGFGFAKNTAQNFHLLRHLSEFHQLGFPIMIGLSRKRMLADALTKSGIDNCIENRIPAGIAAAIIAVQQGVSIIRTHDVAQTAQALSVFNTLSTFNTLSDIPHEQ